MEADTLDKVCKLQTDHHDLKESWILLDGANGVITEQKNGESATDSVRIKVSAFNRMVKWYTKQQRLRKR